MAKRTRGIVGLESTAYAPGPYNTFLHHPAIDGSERHHARVAAILEAFRGRLVTSSAVMAKYTDTSMDFADATLLLLAEHVPIGDILTFGRRGFSAYRTRKGKHVRLVFG
jgi:hypothetical protein